MNLNLIKVGTMFYNKDKTHIATITSRTDGTIEYYWKRVDGMKLGGFMSTSSGVCRVSTVNFKSYIKHDSFKELSSLEMELL